MTFAVPEDCRLEIKFVTEETNVGLLTNWLRLHRDKFDSPYPPRWVNNIYFDTYDYLSFKENLSGSSAREKVRYRWYGREPHPGRGALEIKCKRNFFGWKHRFAIDAAPYSAGDLKRDFIDKLNQQLPARAQTRLASSPQPMILNRYLRQYYVTSDQKVRATIDVQQSVYDQRYKPYFNTDHKTNIPKVLVLELKFNREDRDRAASVMQGIPIRVSRNSKYITGLRSAQNF